MPTVLYARKSQESEERQAQSIDDQLRLCRETARRNNLTILEEITESKSAKEPAQRPGFARMLHLLQTGVADGVLAWHPDRLSRNELDAAQLTYLIRKGTLTSLQFVTYTFQNSAEGLMMLQMALSQSQYYSTKLATDVKRGMQSKADKGWCPHRAPEGYANDIATRTVVPDPARFPLVRQAWEMLLTGNYTVGQIVRAMNEEWGYTTRQARNVGNSPTARKRGGGPLALSTAYLMFHNPYYTGSFRIKGRMYPGNHPAMVTPMEFAQAQAILARNGKPNPKKHMFAYTGLMRCRCGAAVTAEVKRGRSGTGHYVYYHCTDRKQQCSRISIREEVLEMELERVLRQVTVEAETLALAREEVASWREGQMPQMSGAVEGQQVLTQEEVGKQMQRLLDLHLRGTVTEDVFEQRYASLKEQVAHLDQAGGEQRDQVDRIRESAENALRFREEAHGRFLRGTAMEKREIARALGLSYRFWRGAVEMDLHPALLPHLRVEQSIDGTRRVVAVPASAAPSRVVVYSGVSSGPSTSVHRFETRKVGLRSTKKDAFAPSFSYGGADGRLSKIRCADATAKPESLWQLFSNAPNFSFLIF